MPPLRLLGATLVASAVLVALAPAALADSETHFLGPDGLPNSTLIGTPDGGEMPNYDLGRDLEPGTLLLRTDGGLAETDPARFQQWLASMGGRAVTGYPSVVIWAAGAGFQADAAGVFTVFLLDCPDDSGTNCAELASTTTSFHTGPDWAEVEVAMPAIDHPFSDGHSLGVRVVASDRSDIDLMFAYGYPKFRSRLVISDEAPAATTLATTYFETPPAARLIEPAPVATSLEAETVDTAERAGLGAGFTSWLATTAISTLALAVLGFGLLAAVTPGRKRGRHFVRRGQHLAGQTSGTSPRSEVAVSSASDSTNRVGRAGDW